ncbi:MAG: replication restart helicase PriA [Elusimicrobiota bacterium]
MKSKKYISVVLPIPVFREFFYSTDIDVDIGTRVKVKFGPTTRTGYVTKIHSKKPDVSYPLKPIAGVIDKEPIITGGLMELARRMSKYYISSMGEVLSTVLPASLKPLKRKVKTKDNRNYDKKIPDYNLSAGQKKVVKSIQKDMKAGKNEKYLIHGVTDSGKTEIYMRLIRQIIKTGRQVIILVPEIAITAQLIYRLKARLGKDKVGVWHSKISRGKKMNYIKKMGSGELKVLVGPRSSVFAPFKNLGAVIIDEEQDTSYKQHQSPYYDARWVAEQRCDIENALLILGTATPSVETLYRAKSGDLNYFRIEERIHQDKFPRLNIVDMKREFKESYKSGILSNILIQKMEKTLKANKQILLFINRRGYSSSIICKECGESFKCPKCSIPLAYHSTDNTLVCSWCEYKRRAPKKCPECGESTFNYYGSGTQKVKQILKKFFPDAGIKRMDVDSISKKGKASKIFHNFQNGKFDILVGTQIIAKGWDFGQVDLVGVINSDLGLMSPDFRATERIFTVLKQVAGRTGRGSKRGDVVIQTYNPNHYAIKKLFEKDYNKFYDREIDIRKKAGFPPFTGLINIIGSAKKEKTAEKIINNCKKYIDKNLSGTGVSVLGPAKAPIYKIRGRYRWQLLLKFKKNEEKIKKNLKKMIKERSKKGRLKVDVDPQSML